MQKKTFLQLFLLFGILIISIIFFKTYFVKKKINNSSINVIKEEDTLSFSVKEYFEGFTASPVYSVKAITNGSAKIEEESLEFNSKGKGFASFTISVKDKDGDTMDRLVNVLIQ